MRVLGLLMCFFSGIAHSENIKTIQDVVKLAGPYLITDDVAQNSLIHLYVPKNGVGVVGFSGGDKVSSIEENSINFSLRVTDDKNTIFISNSLPIGNATNFGINTKCGKSISITVHSIDQESRADQIKPKVSITSKGCS